MEAFKNVSKHRVGWLITFIFVVYLIIAVPFAVAAQYKGALHAAAINLQSDFNRK